MSAGLRNQRSKLCADRRAPNTYPIWHSLRVTQEFDTYVPVPDGGRAARSVSLRDHSYWHRSPIRVHFEFRSMRIGESAHWMREGAPWPCIDGCDDVAD